MARLLRSYLPGAVFHLTARTQGHTPWFTELIRTQIVRFMVSSVEVSDARLLAYAVMPNHLHLVIRQGHWELGRVMQPLLLNTALLVQRVHRVEGHVFERRFRDRPCLDPEYVRNGIVYCHLNPVRAGLVDDPADYRWSSHHVYMGTTPSRDRWVRRHVEAETGLSLFARPGVACMEDHRRSYTVQVGWRLDADQHSADLEKGELGPSPAEPPIMCVRRDVWSESLAPFARNPAPDRHRDPRETKLRRSELGEIARQVMVDAPAGITLWRVRSGEKTPAVVALRRRMVKRMAGAGYRGCSIARYLRVSPQCVSSVLVGLRRPHNPLA